MKRDDPKWIIPWSNTFFLYPEIPLEQSGESFTLTGYTKAYSRPALDPGWLR